MTRTFRRLLALAFLLPILAASPARAQLYNAGDPCPEPTAGRIFTQEGAAGPSLVCNGTTLEVDESVKTGPYARGVGTANPKAPLHVAGEAIIGPTTGLACDADRTGAIRWSAADLTFEMCDGTEWKKIVATSADGTPSTPPAGSGYFVLTNGSWDGDLKAAGAGTSGFDGANKLCLSDLTTNDWLGKADAQARGMLTSGNVKAFLCYGSNNTTGGAGSNICQNPFSNGTYVFAASGQPAVGGATFTADPSSQGPQNTQNWSGANYFGSSSFYWTGRRGGTATLWPVGGQWSASGCNQKWDGYGGTIQYPSSGDYGSPNSSDEARWRIGVTSCTDFNRLICLVHPAGGSGADLTPDSFTFTALTNQSLNTVVTSNIVTVAGFDGPLSVYVTGSGSPQLRVNGGAWGNSVAISPGDTLQIRQTTSPSSSTSRSALVTLGAAAVDWTVTTAVGEVPVGNTGLTCDAGAAGTVRYNSGGIAIEFCNGTSWVPVGNTVGGATGQSMIAGWPDVIVCTVTNPSLGKTTFHLISAPGATATYRRPPTSGSSAPHDLSFNADGTFNSYLNMTTTDCNASIATLVSSGKAFNLANGAVGTAAQMSDGTAGAPGLYFLSDANTGLYRPGNDILALATAGVEALRVSATGSVGIGTITPQAMLDVGGTDALIVPRGTTAQQPGTPVNGMIRYNSTTNKFEAYQNGAWTDMIGGGAATPAGADREIQFNNAGALGASSTFKLMSDGDLLLTGTYTGTASVPVTGAGTRMFFDTQKGAFRAGHVDGTQWDDANIGNYSVAMGRNATAKNCDGAVAIGNSVMASDCGAVALGAGNNATSGWTFATGYGASAQQSYSSAIGYGVTAVGDSSHVLGRQLVASGTSSFAIGREVVAGNGVLWGGGNHSMAIGLGDSSGANSATWPRVTGDSSLGIFMGDQANANITASNVMAVLGGSVVIDPDTTSSATATAKAPLQVVGEVIVGTTTGLACDADRKGGLRWSDADGTIQMCDGVDWKKISAATCDNAPAFPSFTTQNDLATSSLTTSNIVLITGMDAGCTAGVSVSGTGGSPEYRTCSDAACSSEVQTWTAANNTLDIQGDYLQLRATSSASQATAFVITLNVGPVSSTWTISTGVTGCAPEGTVCADGTVYAGLSGAATPMYTTRCDAGMTWDGSACTGTRGAYSWNNGNTTGLVDTSLVNGAASDGQAYTAVLITEDSDSAVGGVQPHQAAQYCADLVMHGYDDWYLPAKNEFHTMVLNKTAIGNFDVSGTYYSSSSEHYSNGAWIERPSDGNQHPDDYKSIGRPIRCARR